MLYYLHIITKLKLIIKMIAKIWQSILSFIPNFKQHPQPKLISDYPRNKHYDRLIVRSNNNSQHKQFGYQITTSDSNQISIQQHKNQKQILKDGQINQDILLQIRNMQEEFEQINKIYEKLSLNDENINQSKLQQIKEIIGGEDKEGSNNLELEGQEVAKAYRNEIIKVVQFKYMNELVDYPKISIEDYNKIRKIWESNRNDFIIKQSKILKAKITYHNIKTLSYHRWLNDEVINGYIQLMNLKLAQKNKLKYRNAIEDKIQSSQQQIGEYIILDTFFVGTTLNKQPEMVRRALNRKYTSLGYKINQKKIFIIAINHNSHWFFIKINNNRIYIYDSIQHNVQYYQEMTIFNKLKQFTKWYYGRLYTLQVWLNFPQQKNSYDCGVMMLFGIKDVVRDKNWWSFQQKCTVFKRFQIANQIINQNITGFD